MHHYDYRCIIHTTLDELREEWGSNQYSWIQGINARDSRRLYHQLLPKCIVDSPKYKDYSICQKLI